MFYSSSLLLFLQKLQSKNQSVLQQNQAKHSVSLFFKMQVNNDQLQMKDENRSKPLQQKISPSYVSEASTKSFSYPSSVSQNTIQQNYSDQSKPNNPTVNRFAKNTGISWEFVYDQLVKEIKIRHYSPRTLKSYRGYIRQLQTFTKSKNYQTLSQQDVIDFLTFLTVEKQVSASSQNLAFNSLLFLFKQVLKKEFGVVRGLCERSVNLIFLWCYLGRRSILSLTT